MPDREWFHIGANGRDLAIYVYGEIPTSADDFFSAINSIPVPERVDIYVNSMGGSLFTGFAIANRIGDWQRAGVHVRAHVAGVAGSAAALVARAADEVLVPEDGFLFIHQPEYEDGREPDAHSERMSAFMAERLARKVGRGADEIRDLMSNATWLSAAEAVSLGLADAVTGGEE